MYRNLTDPEVKTTQNSQGKSRQQQPLTTRPMQKIQQLDVSRRQDPSLQAIPQREPNLLPPRGQPQPEPFNPQNGREYIAPPLLKSAQKKYKHLQQ